MEIIEIDKKIQTIEVNCKQNIFALNFLGFNVWPVFRLLKTHSKLPKSKSENPNRVLPWVFDVPALIRLFFLSKNKTIIRNSSASYNIQSEGKKESKRAKVIIDAVGKKNVLVLGVLKDDEKNYYLQKNLMPNIDFPINFIKRLVPSVKMLLKPIAKSFIDRKSIHFIRLKITPTQGVDKFANFLAEFLLYYCLYSLIKPRCVLFLNASYGNEGEIMAIKKIKCRVLEYEHGYAWPEQVGYSYNSCLRPIKNRMVIPDKFLVFGQYWKDIFMQKGFYKNNDLLVVGNPNFYGCNRMQKDTNTVLITTQPGYSQQMQKFLSNYLRNSEYSKDKIFLIKCHPRETEYDYKKWLTFAQEFPEKIIPSKEDTMELLNKCPVLVSGTSTTLFDALYFNCTNYILLNDFGKHKSAMWEPEFGRLIDENYVGDLLPMKKSLKIQQIVPKMWPSFDRVELNKILSK